MNGTDGAGGLTLHERIEKLERQMADILVSMAEHLPMTRTLVDGKIRRASEPHILMSILAGAVAVALLLLTATFILLQYLVTNPMPVFLHIPPPHSSQLPKERP